MCALARSCSCTSISCREGLTCFSSLMRSTVLCSFPPIHRKAKKAISESGERMKEAEQREKKYLDEERMVSSGMQLRRAILSIMQNFLSSSSIPSLFHSPSSSFISPFPLLAMVLPGSLPSLVNPFNLSSFCTQSLLLTYHPRL